MTASLVLPARGRVSAPLILAAAVIALAFIGGGLAVAAFTAGDPDAGHPHGPELGEAAPTSFGSITFEHVANLGGLTADALGGVTHGIQNLVLEGQAQIELSVLVANTSDRSVLVSPDQFSLAVDGVPDPVALTGTTIQAVGLKPGASIEATFTFVAPQTGAAMAFTYADPGGEALTLAAGQLDLASPDAGHSH